MLSFRLKRYASRRKSGKSALFAWARAALSYFTECSWIAFGILKAYKGPTLVGATVSVIVLLREYRPPFKCCEELF